MAEEQTEQTVPTEEKKEADIMETTSGNMDNNNNSASSISVSNDASNSTSNDIDLLQTSSPSKEFDHNNSATITIPELPPALEHDWEKGDHLIRWEMLPIAYPIQIHAIVLEANPEFVKLVDFGLTAVPNHETEEEKDESEETKKKKFDVLHKYLVKPLQPNKNNKKKKERLIIRVLTTQKEIKQWSKVNYNGGLFGLGKKKGKNKENSEDDVEEGKSGNENENNESGSSKKSWYNPMGVSMNMFGKKASVSENSSEDIVTSKTDTSTENVEDETSKAEEASKGEESTNQDDENDKSAPATRGQQLLDMAENDNAVERQEDFLQKATAESQKLWIHKQAISLKRSVRKSYNETKTLTQNSINSINEKRASSGGLFGSLIPKASPTKTESGENDIDNLTVQTDTDGTTNGEDNTSPKEQPRASPKFMNPAMAKLMESTKNKASSTFSFSKSISKSTKEKEKETKKKSKLPKDDPIPLVLARANFLLEHGETVLPPYNVFSSNSETIAVWCKTGHFRTIQADVFLHSTAIGNGKSAGVIAMGVAATSGLAAAGVAGIGVAAVIAPWWYLKHSKDKTRDGTGMLNDAFWASDHATPDVFVACIEEWGVKPNEKKEDKETKPEDIQDSPSSESPSAPEDTATDVVNDDPSQQEEIDNKESD